MTINMLFDTYLFEGWINVAFVLAAFFIDFRFRNAPVIYMLYLFVLVFRAFCWTSYDDTMALMTGDDSIYLQKSVINGFVWITVGWILDRIFVWCFNVPCYVPGTKDNVMIEYIDKNELKYKLVPAPWATDFFVHADGKKTKIHKLNQRIFVRYLLVTLLILIPLLFIECAIPLIGFTVDGVIFVLVICLIFIFFDYWSNRKNIKTIVDMEDKTVVFEAKYESEYLWDDCKNYTGIYIALALLLFIFILPAWIFPGLLCPVYCLIIVIPAALFFGIYAGYCSYSTSQNATQVVKPS
jgi:hypothetical protein